MFFCIEVRLLFSVNGRLSLWCICRERQCKGQLGRVWCWKDALRMTLPSLRRTATPWVKTMELTSHESSGTVEEIWRVYPSASQSVPTLTLWSGHKYMNYCHSNVKGPLLNKGPYNCWGFKCLPANLHHSKPPVFLEFALPCPLVVHCWAGPTCRDPQRQCSDSCLECFSIPSN